MCQKTFEYHSPRPGEHPEVGPSSSNSVNRRKIEEPFASKETRSSLGNTSFLSETSQYDAFEFDYQTSSKNENTTLDISNHSLNTAHTRGLDSGRGSFNNSGVSRACSFYNNANNMSLKTKKSKNPALLDSSISSVSSSLSTLLKKKRIDSLQKIAGKKSNDSELLLADSSQNKNKADSPKAMSNRDSSGQYSPVAQIKLEYRHASSHFKPDENAENMMPRK